jgi:hypothetical protein
MKDFSLLQVLGILNLICVFINLALAILNYSNENYKLAAFNAFAMGFCLGVGLMIVAK